MKIVVAPNSILVNKSEAVTRFDKKLRKTINDMKKALDATRDPVGVGLAAPQVGISKRIFLSKPEPDGKTSVFINPEIIAQAENSDIPVIPNSEKIEKMKNVAKHGGPTPKKGTLLEGCLSLPNIWGNVSRKKEVTINYQDEKGNSHTETFKGFPAIIIQHEIDHLEGILFTKHVIAQNEQLYKSHKNAEGEDEFEEMEI